MARVHFYVVNRDGRWAVRHNGQLAGPFVTQQAAINEAVEAAHRAGDNGADSDVVVESTDGRFRTEWTYGDDPRQSLAD